MKVAIIGAGLSGLTLTHQLKSECDVTIFEKSRGFGGRMATRRADLFAFDHGAQYFTIKSDRFRRFLNPYLESGVVAEWDARLVTIRQDGSCEPRPNSEPLYVASPSMNALGKALAEELDVKGGIEVRHLERTKSQWLLHDKDDGCHGPFDWVISTAPAPQSAALFPSDFAHRDIFSSVQMSGCFTFMLGLAEIPDFDFDGAFFDDDILGWMALNHTKPSRSSAPALVLQARNDWSGHHLEDDRDTVAAIMLARLEERTGFSLETTTHKSLHRWRYANVTQSAPASFFVDDALNLALCGDWCLKGRVEAAFESADKLASHLLKERLCISP